MANARLRKRWEEIQGSYWFLPTMMALAAVVLFFITTTIDGWTSYEWVNHVPWIYESKPEGARVLLSTIAGSMITVAGVTFSITIAAVAYATSQFGPRLLTNFMQDRGNQLTLGTFIATFIYCLLVLRTIRSPDETPGGELTGGFVPHVATLGGFLLALASVGVFIFFIHHVTESIHASHVIAEIGKDLDEKIDKLFPEAVDDGPSSVGDIEAEVPSNFLNEATPVCARGSGYLSQIDSESLMKTAGTHDLVLRLTYRPGEFVTPQQEVVLAWPPDRVDETVKTQIRDAFAWGHKRTQGQDILFLVNEPVEIAARALSTGMNDPVTAMHCMDWLGGALAKLAGRALLPRHRYDEEGNLRLLARPLSFEHFANAVFGQLRPYVQEDVNASLHMMKIIAEVVASAKKDTYRHTLLQHATSLREGCSTTFSLKQDLHQLDNRHRVVARLVNEPESQRILADQHEWLGGSA